jgi:hypothetical protein
MLKLKKKKEKEINITNTNINTKSNSIIPKFMNVDFLHYPELNDSEFYKKIYLKKEFNETKTKKETLDKTTMEELCNPPLFKLKPEQEFIRNFISPFTHYNGLLVFWGVGVGKTCASIQIAEGLKEQVLKMNKKIYVIGKKQIQNAFSSDLYNFYKEKSEMIKGLNPGSLQCTGESYYISKADEPDENKRINKIINNIKQLYRFSGMKEFSNYADKKIGANRFAEVFSNAVFIIDEAHSLAGESKKKGEDKKEKFAFGEEYLEDIDIDEEDEDEDYDDLIFDEFEDEDEELEDIDISAAVSVAKTPTKSKLLQKEKSKNITGRGILTVIHDIIDKTEGTKFILLSATPMKDNENELIDILNILLHNDKRMDLYPIDKNKLFIKSANEDEIDINEDYLRLLSRGYISYVRGENPKIFPEIIDINPDNIKSEEPKIYIPKPIYNEAGIKINEKDLIKHLELVRCPMSEYQYGFYREVIMKLYKNIGQTSDNERSPTDVFSRMASNIIFPNSTKSNILFGNKGFDETFQKVKLATVKLGNKVKSRQIIQYKYISNDGFLNINEIGKYSKKLETYLNIVFNSNNKNPTIYDNGIIFTYSNFEKTGALLIALALEENGYQRYRSSKATDNINLLYVDPKKQPIKRCMCGRLENDTSVHGKSDTDILHKFKQAYYCILSSQTSDYIEDELKAVKNENNKYGEKIKVILGTSIASESLNFLYVRSVHIFDPWHNNTRQYQVVGRGMRTCSHKSLDISERNITVYNYCSSPTEYIKGKLPKPEKTSYGNLGILKYKDLLTETADEKVYRRIERKDIIVKRIERILKVISNDCKLNKELNLYGLEGKNGQRQCDYKECDYNCEGGVEELNDDIQLNLDTYNLYFSKPYILITEKIIYELFKFNFSVDLKNIITFVKEIDPKIEDKYIYEALNNIIKKKFTIKDRYGRTGHIIYTNPYAEGSSQDDSYYIFQPDDLLDVRAPLYYKSTPLQIKTKKVTIDNNINNNNTKTKRSHLNIKNSNSSSLTLLDKSDSKSNSKSGSSADTLDYNKIIMNLKKLNKYEIDYNIDRLLDKIKIRLFEYAVRKGVKEIYNSFNRYDNVYLKLERKDIIIHNMIKDKWRLFTKGSWTDVSDKDKTVATVKFDKIENKKKNRSNYIGLFMLNEKNINSLFKFNDMTKQKDKKKISALQKGTEEYSKRNQLRGKVCSSYQLNELYEFAEKIGIKDNMTTLIKPDICKRIELKLRELDDTDNSTTHFELIKK